MPISSSLAAPLVVVVGSTGNQGGSVIQALADSDRPYRIRGITRDITKPAAQKLSSQGVEMMNLSLTADNANAVRTAFAEADIVFMVTNFWEHLDKTGMEAAEGKMMVDAAKAADVKLLVWSALEPCAEVSKGKYIHIDHFDGKGEITAYARLSGVPLLIVHAGWYMTNHMLFNGFIPTKEPDGSYALALSVGPDTVMPVIDPCMTMDYLCERVLNLPRLGQEKNQITGKKVVYKQISDEEFMAATKAPPRIALELLEMMKYYEEFGYFADKDKKSIRQHLNRAPRTWADFVRANDWSSVFV
ncbi:NAD(P)-binding protein [Mycena leptocephala]|nr:NAD(P)-binding protein [Mycena leptocephala]